MRQLSPLQHLVEIILDEVKTEKIFLMNSMGYKKENDATYVTNMFGTYVYNLLILVKGTKKRYEDIRSNIKSRYSGSTPVDILLWSVPYFNKSINEKVTSVLQIQETACVLYDASDDRRELQQPEEADPTDKWLTNMRADLVIYYHIGLDFLKAAEAHLNNKDLRLAAFCLHQAMEYFVSMTLQVMTGYRVAIHNINELHRFSSTFLPEMSLIMPHHHERQRLIHGILYRAYQSGDEPIPESELYAIAADLQNIRRVIRGAIF